MSKTSPRGLVRPVASREYFHPEATLSLYRDVAVAHDVGNGSDAWRGNSCWPSPGSKSARAASS